MSTSEEYISTYKELLGLTSGSELAMLVEQQLSEMWNELSPQEQTMVVGWLYGHV